MAITLSFASGTLEVRGLEPAQRELFPALEWDARTESHRAAAVAYADVVRSLVRAGLPYEDRARNYAELDVALVVARKPRPYQKEAHEAWLRARGRGVVVLPTGAGKSHVAILAAAEKKRSTLVVAPTLDLVRQWYDLLRTSFGTDVGVIGGGEYRPLPLTVTTYDSAYLHMESLGAKFGLVVFDECHHLPGEAYALAARFCLAPFRLGLSATPERTDGRDALLVDLIGPTVYRKDILELSGEYLAAYDTERIALSLTVDERAEYASERAIYLDFLRAQGIRMGTPSGFGEFIMRSATSSDGPRAMQAYRRQRELSFAARSKLDMLEQLLHEHRKDRVLVFTEDNATAYAVSKRFLVPAITHQTKVTERSEMLARFADGRYGVIVTSKVLNEGVDVPDANVAVVLSGSGSVREHVQRLGRVLRPKEGKRAILYELVSADTLEAFTSERRREHDAYR
ncbi:MAG TPA: DEAD/DEAH box helicase family protein [Polyangiaceae bacterium]|nr:DEAD/DEAH box helicase family protein [Polyangiaceae bacterium]